MFAITISSSCNKGKKKNPKSDNDDENVICHNCYSSCNKYNSKKGKRRRWWWTCYNAHHCPTHQYAQEKKLEKNIIPLML